MCKSALHPLLEQLPKCEHHVHVEGCMTPTLLFRLAERNKVTLPTDTYPAFESAEALQARYDAGFSSLDDFLQPYFVGCAVLVTARDFEDLAWEYFSRAAAQGVAHAELFFDPQSHTSRGIALEACVMAGLVAAKRRAVAELGMTVELIMCFLRHLSAEDADRTYAAAREYVANRTILGVGLDSSEKGFVADRFSSAYAAAAADGARRTAHAGEEAGPESIWAALRALGAERIDHGRTMPQDPELLAEARRRRLLVTTCPLSNLKLKSIATIADAPIRVFLDNDVPFSINGDDPAFFGGWILENYCAVQEAFDLRVADWHTICRNSIQGSWCADERKEELLARLKGVIEKYSSDEKGAKASS